MPLFCFDNIGIITLHTHELCDDTHLRQKYINR